MLNQDTDKLYAPYPTLTAAMVVLAGCLAGIGTYLIGALLSNFMIGPALCQSAGANACADSSVIALHIANIISSILSAALLIRANVYRPLLVIIATLVATWPLITLVSTLPWYGAILSLLAASVFAYSIFSWLLRLYNFILALIIMAAIITLSLLVTLS